MSDGSGRVLPRTDMRGFLRQCPIMPGVLLPVLVACSGNSPATARLSDAGSTQPGAADLDAAIQTYGPYDSHIQYVGRIDTSDPAGPWMMQSASVVTVAFRGTTAAVEINDDTVSGGASDFFDVVIDNGPPSVLTPLGSAAWIPIVPLDDAGVPVPLANDNHTLTLVKRTEATVGRAQFLGFQFSEIQSPKPDPTPLHRIEIIGDSIACGYGVEAASSNAPECVQNGLGLAGYGQGLEDAYQSFGVVAAVALNAQWHVTCESGVGLVRNNDNGYIDPRPMPEIFPYLYPEVPSSVTPWPTTQWASRGNVILAAVPDVVIIELGGNDQALTIADGGTRPPIPVGSPTDPPDAGPSLVGGFLRFIAQLAGDYPGASFVLVANSAEVQQAIQVVAGAYGDGGADDGGVRVVGYPENLPYPGAGCAGHPNVAQQASAGLKTATFIRAVMGW